MRTICQILFALGLTALVASPALAQGGRGGGGRGGLGQLLGNDSVLKELKIEKEQADKVKEAVQKVRDDNKDDIAKLQDQNTSREDRAEISKKLNTAYEKAVADILNADQKKRLKQIVMQQQGVRAFADADVVKALSLTDDQKSKIKDISDDLNKQMQDLRGGGGGGGRGNFQKIQEATKKAMDDINGTLTDDQKKALKELMGETFQLQGGGRGRGPGTTPPRTRET